MAVRLLVPVPIGMANNGDAGRLMCQLGADVSGPPAEFVRFRYHHAAAPCAHGYAYPTTQLVQLKVTDWVHHVFGISGVIDMRELIVEDSVLVGIALAVLVWLLRSAHIGYRLAAAIGFFLVLADGTFAGYAASPLSEPAALIGVTIVALAGVALVGNGRHRGTALFFVWLGAVLIVGAKEETVPLLLPLCLLLGSQRLPWGDLRGRFSSRVIPLLCAFWLLPVMAWAISTTPANLQAINFSNELTMTMMPMSSDPGSVAAGLGLPRSFGEYSGRNWWSVHAIEKDPQFPRYVNRFTRGNLAHYFVAHPILDARIVSGGATAYLALRPQLGSYGVDSGHAPFAQECRVCVVTDVAHASMGTGFAGIIAYWLACLLGVTWLWRRSAAGTLPRGFAVIGLTLISITLIEYFTAVFGEGNEVTKHLVVGLFAACLTPLWLLSGAMASRPIHDVDALKPSTLVAGEDQLIVARQDSEVDAVIP